MTDGDADPEDSREWLEEKVHDKPILIRFAP
jgi:hypothetical protein